MFDLESNSGEKVPHSKRSRKLKEDRAYNNESSAIGIRDSIAEDTGVNCAIVKSKKGTQRQ